MGVALAVWRFNQQVQDALTKVWNTPNATLSDLVKTSMDYNTELHIGLVPFEKQFGDLKMAEINQMLSALPPEKLKSGR
jgi:hypothetical protein